jgi:hypothetical protein
MKQKNELFRSFTVTIQTKNSLFTGTNSHLNDKKLCHQLMLVKQCQGVKLHKVEALKTWLDEVWHLDDLMRAEKKQFEEIAARTQDNSCRAFALGKPSRKTNLPSQTHTNYTNTTSRDCTYNRASKANDGDIRPLKLSLEEHNLLMKNDGCLKCQHFFAGHHADNCPYDFPSTENYRPLMYADMKCAKRGPAHNQGEKEHKPKKTLVVTSMMLIDDKNENAWAGPSQAHPIAAIMGLGHPVAYAAPNTSNVLREGNDDSDSDVSKSPPVVDVVLSDAAVVDDYATATFGDATMTSDAAASAVDDVGADDDDDDDRDTDPQVTHLCVPHLWWDCAADRGHDSFPVQLRALIDNGCHTVLIREDEVNLLSCCHWPLQTPKEVELAMMQHGPKQTFILKEYVCIALCDPENHWKSKTICTMIAPNPPILLGLLFMTHNNIIIDYYICSIIDKTTGFNLLQLNHRWKRRGRWRRCLSESLEMLCMNSATHVKRLHQHGKMSF